MAAPAVKKQVRGAQARIEQIEAAVRRGEPAPLLRVNGTRLPPPPIADADGAPLDPGTQAPAAQPPRPARSPTFQPLTAEEIAAADALTEPAAAPVRGTAEVIPMADAPADDQNTVKYWRDRALAAEGITKKAKQQQDAAVRAAVAEVEGRTITELQDLRAEVARLQAELDKIPRIINVEDYFTREEIEELGEPACRKIIERQERIAKSTIEQAVKPLQQELKKTRETSAATARKTFYSDLDRMAPGWRETNVDPRFADEFLSQMNPRAGVTERDLIMLAFQAQDAERVASFFTAFKEALGTVRDPAHRVVPNGDAPPMPSIHETGPKKVKRSEIAQFQADVARGKHKRNPKYVQEKMAEYNLAARENRIIEG